MKIINGNLTNKTYLCQINRNSKPDIMKSLHNAITTFIVAIFIAGFSVSAQQVANVQRDNTRLEASETVSGPAVAVEGRVIEFTGDSSSTVKFEVFSITGQLVRTLMVGKDQTVRIELQRGCYIIKCSSWTKRVMLK